MMQRTNFFLSRKYPTYIILLAFFLFLGCKHGKRTKFPRPDIKIDRFEKDLFAINVYNIPDSVNYLQRKYPGFLPLYGYKIIEAGGPDQPGFGEGLTNFVTDFTIYRVNKRVAEVFPVLDVYEKELSKAFGLYRSFFPDKKLPQIVTCISGFNQSVVIADSLLVICLDKYLGKNDEFYKLIYPPVPEYLRYVMVPEKIPSDALYSILISDFGYNAEKDNLLSQMVYYGRAMYCTKKLFPSYSDTLLWGFTPAQLMFCKNNEKKMWEYLIEQKLLFSTDKLVLNKFVNVAPFTKDFSAESPGRAAVWTGYQIVGSYIRNNKEVDVYALMNETDYLKILNLSKYNP